MTISIYGEVMRICFVHEEYPLETNFGGIATYQKITAEYYANNGDDVYVVTRGKHNNKYVENKVNIIRIASENNPNNINSIKDYRKKVAKVLIELQKKNFILYILQRYRHNFIFEKKRL